MLSLNQEELFLVKAAEKFSVSLSLLTSGQSSSTSSPSPSVVPSPRESVLTLKNVPALEGVVPVGDETLNLVPALERDGPLGVKGEILSVVQLGEHSKTVVNDYVMNSLSAGTKRIYNLVFRLFINFGHLNGVQVEKFTFDFSFVCAFLLYRLQQSSSLHSVLSTRAAINFYWKLHSVHQSLTESPYVSMFIKGLSRKFSKVPCKAYHISYDELSKKFTHVIGILLKVIYHLPI